MEEYKNKKHSNKINYGQKVKKVVGFKGGEKIKNESIKREYRKVSSMLQQT